MEYYLPRNAKEAEELPRPKSEGERQARLLFEEHKRENYKKCPWGSFFIAALVNGIILLIAASQIASSPLQIFTAQIRDIHMRYLCAIFAFISVLLLIPATFYFLFVVGRWLFRKFDTPCPCTRLERIFLNKPKTIDQPLLDSSRRSSKKLEQQFDLKHEWPTEEYPYTIRQKQYYTDPGMYYDPNMNKQYIIALSRSASRNQTSGSELVDDVFEDAKRER